MQAFKDWVYRQKHGFTPPRVGYGDYLNQPSLPVLRPRALTLPFPKQLSNLPDSVKAIVQKKYTQEDSLFFRLPPELRLKIYKYIFGDRTVHIEFYFWPEQFRKKSDAVEWRCWHCVCQYDAKKQQWWNDEEWHNTRQDMIECRGARTRCVIEKDYDKLDINFLLTCRKIYSEGIDTLYRSNSFYIEDHRLLRNMANLILPQRLNVISSIRLTWRAAPIDEAHDERGYAKSYSDLWEILGTFSGLRELRVFLVCWPYKEDIMPDEHKQKWLGPLKSLESKQLDVLDFAVPSSYYHAFIRGSWMEESGYKFVNLVNAKRISKIRHLD